MLLLDVAPLSLGGLESGIALSMWGSIFWPGIEMAGGMMQKLIERNSTIPTNKSQAQLRFIRGFFWGESGEVKCQDFTTAEDYQDHVEIKVGRLKRPCPCPSLCTWRSTRASEPWSKQLGRQRQICSTFAALG